MGRGENKVNSFIFGKLPYKIQILCYNHIFMSKKKEKQTIKQTNWGLFVKFTEFLNYIFFQHVYKWTK